jgi:hypothetical protein
VIIQEQGVLAINQEKGEEEGRAKIDHQEDIHQEDEESILHIMESHE